MLLQDIVFQFNQAKVITAIILVVMGIIVGIIEIRKNPEYWLNRFFAAFFIIGSFGFLSYTVYHIYGLLSEEWIIPEQIAEDQDRQQKTEG